MKYQKSTQQKKARGARLKRVVWEMGRIRARIEMQKKHGRLSAWRRSLSYKKLNGIETN